MLQVNMLMDLGNGTSVVGTPGYLSPADKARLDALWRERKAGGLSYEGDIQGYTTTDSLGNAFAVLTVPELENIRAELEEVKEKLDALSNAEAVDVTPIEERLSAVESQLATGGDTSAVDEINDRLNSIESQLTTGGDTSAVDEINDRLKEVEARMDAAEYEQREYMRRVDFDSTTGILSFKDGYNDEVYTVGGATSEPVTVEPATVEG